MDFLNELFDNKLDLNGIWMAVVLVWIVSDFSVAFVQPIRLCSTWKMQFTIQHFRFPKKLHYFPTEFANQTE